MTRFFFLFVLTASCSVDHTGLIPLGGDAGMDGVAEECARGEERECGTSVGVCVSGRETCVDGRWGRCEGGVGPSVEVCDLEMLDEDCDGVPNNTCPCDAGDVQSCGESAVGACRLGTSTCDASGAWGVCLDAVGPQDETCNGVDDDCDDSVDEELQTTFYEDSDADGVGNTDVSMAACEAPTGYVERSGDCDDEDRLRFPGNPEVCDGVDNDCNGMADDGLPLVRYFPDADRDGFGDDAAGIEACTRPSGFLRMGGDCDDTNDAVKPGAPEICDVIDNDCDGLKDEGTPCGPACTVREHGGHVYLFCQLANDWPRAGRVCQTRGDDDLYGMVSVDNAAEDAFLDATRATLGDGDEPWWIGLNDRAVEGAYVWENGSPAVFRNWASGVPSTPGEDCVYTFGATGNGWDDGNCTADQWFICEELD